MWCKLTLAHSGTCVDASQLRFHHSFQQRSILLVCTCKLYCFVVSNDFVVSDSDGTLQVLESATAVMVAALFASSSFQRSPAV